MPTAAYPTEFELALLPRQDFIDWMFHHKEMSAGEAAEMWDNHEARQYHVCDCGKPVKVRYICDECLAFIEAHEEELERNPISGQPIGFLDPTGSFADDLEWPEIPELQPIARKVVVFQGEQKEVA